MSVAGLGLGQLIELFPGSHECSCPGVSGFFCLHQVAHWAKLTPRTLPMGVDVSLRPWFNSFKAVTDTATSMGRFAGHCPGGQRGKRMQSICCRTVAHGAQAFTKTLRL